MRRSRATVLFCCILFTAAFHLMYVLQLAKIWSYLGFLYCDPSMTTLALGWGACILPGLWLPMDIKRPSHLINWILYVTVYVSSILIPLYVEHSLTLHTFMLLASIVIAFHLQAAIPLLKCAAIKRPPIDCTSVWILIGALIVGGTAFILITYGHSMKLVGFDDVYSLRADNHQEGAITYVQNWLSSALYPLLVSYGLHMRKKWMVVAGAAGEIMLYSAVAMKSVLLSIPVYVGVFLILRKSKNRAGIKVSLATALLAIISCATAAFQGPIALMLGAIIGVRTLGTPGLCTYQYDMFFSKEHWTYLSQVRGIDFLVSYPYPLPVDRLIGRYFYNTFDMVANTHPFAQDGLSGFGIYGIIPIGILMGITWLVLDCVASRHAPRFVCLFTVYTAMNIANASLFTTITSFGLWLILLVLYVLPTVPAGSDNGAVQSVEMAAAKSRKRLYWQVAR